MPGSRSRPGFSDQDRLLPGSNLDLAEVVHDHRRDQGHETDRGHHGPAQDDPTAQGGAGIIPFGIRTHIGSTPSSDRGTPGPRGSTCAGGHVPARLASGFAGPTQTFYHARPEPVRGRAGWRQSDRLVRHRRVRWTRPSGPRVHLTDGGHRQSLPPARPGESWVRWARVRFAVPPRIGGHFARNDVRYATDPQTPPASATPSGPSA